MPAGRRNWYIRPRRVLRRFYFDIVENRDGQFDHLRAHLMHFWDASHYLSSYLQQSTDNPEFEFLLDYLCPEKLLEHLAEYLTDCPDRLACPRCALTDNPETSLEED